ncbi:MAG: IS110 family transposase [Proteobacteria bacterium]|nr:IS110 family transposase [Pseudomonadota bacterium]
MGHVTLTGIDLSKESFEICCENHAGTVVKRRSVRRGGLIEALYSLPQGSVVAMEACGSAHYWGQECCKLGLEVKLIAPQHVTPFRMAQKNDRNDAQAICRAAREPGLRRVPLKNREQLDLQTLHRVRERLVKQHTALMNQVRGILLERGITIPQGKGAFRSKVQELVIIFGTTNQLGFILSELWEEFLAVEKRVAAFTKRLIQMARVNEQCKLISALPGVGPITATALVAAIADVSAFRNGRAFAAALRLVPRQHTTGGRTRLGSITKQGNGYLRKLLVHGARSVVRYAVLKQREDRKSLWIRNLHQRGGTNRTSVGLANKTARQAWAILAGKQPLSLAA